MNSRLIPVKDKAELDQVDKGFPPDLWDSEKEDYCNKYVSKFAVLGQKLCYVVKIRGEPCTKDCG
jgi:hypothetical protein